MSSVVSRLRYITYRQLAPTAPLSRLTDDDGDGDEWSDDVRRSSRLHRLLRPSTSLTSLSRQTHSHIRYLALTALSLLKQCCALSVCPIPQHKNSAFRVLAMFYCVPRPCSCWRGTVVERRSLAGELSLSCARPAADG